MTALHQGSVKSIAVVLTGAALVMTGVGLFQTLLPLRADDENFSTTLVGVLGTSYFAGFIAGCLIGPALVKAVGHIRAFAGSVAVAAAATLVFPMVIDAVVWPGLRFLTGLALAVCYMVIESWLNDQTSNASRGQVLSIYIIIANCATIAGQLMINLAPTAGAGLFMAVAILTGLSAVPVALTPAHEPTPIPTAKFHLRDLLSISPVGTIGCLLVGAVEGAFWTLGPVFGGDRGMGVFEITVLMAAFVAGGTISQWPLGRLSDKYDRRLVIAPVALATVATGLIIAYTTPAALWMTLAMAAVHGALMIPIYALCLAHANDNVANERLVQVSSGLLLIYALGAAIGPLAAAQIMTRVGEGGLFLFISGVLAVFSVFICARVVLSRGGGRAQPSPFAPVPKTSQSVYELEVDDDPPQANRS